MIKNHGNHYDNAKAVLGFVIVLAVFAGYAFISANQDYLYETGSMFTFFGIFSVGVVLLLVLFFLASQPQHHHGHGKKRR